MTGADKTFYFGQYQGFRQVLGTTQVFPVPTAAERAGHGHDGLSRRHAVRSRQPADRRACWHAIPCPTIRTGAYGAAHLRHVFEGHDRRGSVLHPRRPGARRKDQLFGRFTFDNLTGPTTNPDQTAIDPSFGVQYVDRQRNVASPTRALFLRACLEVAISITRTTPPFPTPNHTDPALKFNDGLFEAFNSAGGSVMTAFSNLFQLRQTFHLDHRQARDESGRRGAAQPRHHLLRHQPQRRVRLRRRHGIFSGRHTVGERHAQYSRLAIRCPTRSPACLPAAHSRTRSRLRRHISQTARTSAPPPSTATRELSIFRTLGRYQTASCWTTVCGGSCTRRSQNEPDGPPGLNQTDGGFGRPDSSSIPSQRISRIDNGWGPRVQLDWRASDRLHFHAGGGITTIPPNIWQDNFLTGSTPFVIYPRLTASPGAPIAYGFQITPAELPLAYTPAGQNIFPNGNTKTVAPNTVMDVDRYRAGHGGALAERPDYAAEYQLRSIVSSATPICHVDIRAGAPFGNMTADANYVGTAGVQLPRISFPNAFAGADPGFAQVHAVRQLGCGYRGLWHRRDRDQYGALHLPCAADIAARDGRARWSGHTGELHVGEVDRRHELRLRRFHRRLGSGGAGVSAESVQHARRKGPSTFDITQAFTLSLAQDLHLESVDFLRPVCRKVTARLGAAEHLDTQQRCAVHHLFRHSADRRRFSGGGPAGSDRDAAAFDRAEGARGLLRPRSG